MRAVRGYIRGVAPSQAGGTRAEALPLGPHRPEAGAHRWHAAAAGGARTGCGADDSQSWRRGTCIFCNRTFRRHGLAQGFCWQEACSLVLSSRQHGRVNRRGAGL